MKPASMYELDYNVKRWDERSFTTQMSLANSTSTFSNTIFARGGFDVDIDGSYSTDYRVGDDSDQFAFPLAELGVVSKDGSPDPGAVDLVIEHSLAVDDDERLRCFMLYAPLQSSGAGSGEAQIRELVALVVSPIGKS